MKSKIVIFLITLTLILGCTKNNQSSIEIVNKKDKPKKVTILGSTDDSLAFKYFNILNHSYLFAKNHKYFSKKIENNSLSLILDSIEKPQLMEILAIGNNSYRAQIYAIPGDTIKVEIKNKKIKFFGKNAAYNNFYTELYKSTPDYAQNPYSGNIYTYKDSTKTIYNKKIAFFKSYINKHSINSESYLNTVKSDLKYEYINNLISPRNIKAKGNNYYYNEEDCLIPIIQKEVFNKSEKLFNLDEYLNGISVTDLQDTTALNNSFFFKNIINALIRNHFDISNATPYSKEKLLSEKEFILKNFKGDLKNYAIARMIRDYHKKGLGFSTQNVEFMESLINEFENEFTDNTYKDFMNEIKEDLNSYNFELSKQALTTKLINNIGDTLTLESIFNRSKKRIKVINFWASWCPPCINQIKEGKPFKDKLQIENNVEWIYLSIDKNHQKWLKTSKKFENVLNFSNNFIIVDGNNSSLAKHLKVKSIPRYTILNKENKIVVNNAPSPSDKTAFKKIISEIK